MEIEMNGLQVDFTNKEKPLIFVVSHETHRWDKTIFTITTNNETLDVKQYQFVNQDYPMLGIDHENSLITDNLRQTAKAINLSFSKINNLTQFKKIILLIHDNELFYTKAGQYPTPNKQKLEEKGAAAGYLEHYADDANNISISNDNTKKNMYLICSAFKDLDMNSDLEFELWSFQHAGSKIVNALKYGGNVYEELILNALIPNFKKKLVDIKFLTLQLLLPLYIDFIGLSACDEIKRNEYWDTIKKVSFSNEILKEVRFLINGNGNDNIESISSFAADAGFENNKHWVGLKSLIGKDSNTDDFFELVSKNNLSEVVNAIENFKFSSDENGHMQEITGWADWYASIVEHFDALIAAC